MKTDKVETFIYCFIIVIINGLVLLYYHFKIDPYKDIERHCFKNSKLNYAIFRFVYLIILFSFIFSLRYIVIETINFLR